MTRAWAITMILIAASSCGFWPAARGAEAVPGDRRVPPAKVRILDRDDRPAAPAPPMREQDPPAVQLPAPEQDVPAPRLRDPTEPGDELRDLVAPLRLGQPGTAAGLAVPRVMLKGRIIGPDAPPAAIVDLQGAVYVVHENSELSVGSPEGPLAGLTLRVTEISVSEVRVEILPFRRVMILR